MYCKHGLSEETKCYNCSLESLLDVAIDALEECRDIGERDVMAVADKALKELKTFGKF